MKFFPLLLLGLLPFSLQAEECNMAFTHGILIAPEHIRILQNNRTHVQINADKQLFIRGEWITLTEQDTELLYQYSQGLRKFVPEIVSIAVDGVELGLSSIEAMFTGIGSKAQQTEWRELVRETTFQWMSRFVRTNEHFYLAPQSLNELDYFLHGELKPQLDNLARHTVGAVWGALRDALRHSDTNFERSDNQEWQTVGELVDKINLGLDAKAVELEEKSALFCQRMQELDQIEQQLQQRLPTLTAYDVLALKD
uniref:Methyl-accepting chemotaxis protein n=1 Tax=Rheinheimera sp. BAL341 TaxID=1708203 RepID=A0A486XU58_9GAMM